MDKKKKIKFWSNIAAGSLVLLTLVFPINLLINFLDIFQNILQKALDDGMTQEFQLIFALAFIYLIFQAIKYLYNVGCSFLENAERIKKQP